MTFPKITDFVNKGNITKFVIALPILAVVLLSTFTMIIFIDISTKSSEISQMIVVSIIISLFVLVFSSILSYKIKKVLEEERDIVILEHANMETKLTEQISQTKATTKFLKEIIEIIPIPLFIKDKNFVYTDCNKEFCEFFNKTKDEVIGKTIFDLTSQELASVHQKSDKKLIKLKKDVYQSKVLLSNGEEKIAEFYKVSNEYNYQFNGLVGVIIDITDSENEKKEQKELFQKEQLDNAKFTAIGQLAAGITHEINTPLTYIKGNFEMMGYDIEALPQSDIKMRMIEDKEKISDGISRIANIVEAMREMSQKSKEIKEHINIYSTIVVALTMAHNRSKQISNIYVNGELFDINCDKNKYQVYGFVQKQRIEQVWVIIINNALDELIKIEKFEDRRIDIIIENDNDTITVSFIDNAGGVPEDLIESIFEPFISNKDSSGMGVGLNVAKKIVEDQCGTIEAINTDNIDSRYKKGAIFTVKLPLNECNLKSNDGKINNSFVTGKEYLNILNYEENE